MSEELWNQEEHTEPVSEKKPETAIDENSQGIYKEARSEEHTSELQSHLT